MKPTFFFYDLETSGFSPKNARIMQFAGQRTDLELNPIGEPYNYLIKLSEDVLPDPGAILITKITPQKTIADGLAEAEFLKIFNQEISKPGTIFTGFNSVRFDDDFMRFLHYRNFYDAYEWQWQDGRSRWDLLDLVRMTRALRPDGIKWPFDPEGRPANRLELLTSVNDLEHSSAHDALSDVEATIALARLIRTRQPKLFDFLLDLRQKSAVADFLSANDMFVYTSGKYDSQYEKTTVAAKLTDHPNGQAILVFDLRYDPDQFSGLNSEQLAEAWTRRHDDPGVKLPVKTLKFNRCPAIAPLGVLDESSSQRLSLDKLKLQANYDKLKSSDLAKKVLNALELMEKRRQEQAELIQNDSDVDSRLFDDFFGNNDKTKMSVIRASSVEELKTIDIKFDDSRLNAMLPLYKARNYPKSLTDADRKTWENFRLQKLLKSSNNLPAYFANLDELSKRPSLSGEDKYLLEELRLYGESIMPEAA